MRKTSHDGTDSTSITSGTDNDFKKSGTGIIKSKKSSIKRKVSGFSYETDDGIIEPLLQTNKDKTEIHNRSAKFLLSKKKTDSISEVDDLNIVSENTAMLSASTSISTTNKELPSINMRECLTCTSDDSGILSIHDEMRTNALLQKETRGAVTTKTSLLVEFDGSKSSKFNSSPLIFTTAKIHTDSKVRMMEPVQVTPIPLLSTLESSVLKSEPVSKLHKKSVIINRKGEVASNSASKKTAIDNPQKYVVSAKLCDKSNTIKMSSLTDKTIKNSSEIKKCNNKVGNTQLTSSSYEKETISKSEQSNIVEDISTSSTDKSESIGSVIFNEKESKMYEVQSIIPQKTSTINDVQKEKELNTLNQGVFEKSPIQEGKSIETEKAEITIIGSKKLQRQKKTTPSDADNPYIADKNIVQKVTNETSLTTNTLVTSSSIPISETYPSKSQYTQPSDKKSTTYEILTPKATDKIKTQANVPALSFKTIVTTSSSNVSRSNATPTTKSFPASDSYKDNKTMLTPLSSKQPIMISSDLSQTVKSMTTTKSPNIINSVPISIASTSQNKMDTLVNLSTNIASSTSSSKPDVSNSVTIQSCVANTNKDVLLSTATSGVKSLTTTTASTSNYLISGGTKNQTKSDAHNKGSRA